MQTVFTGPVFVVRDNIDTDQIIPAQYLNLVPTIDEEYEKLGAYAFSGGPSTRGSRAVRRSATRSCRCPCSNRAWPYSTKPIRDSTSMPYARWPVPCRRFAVPTAP